MILSAIIFGVAYFLIAIEKADKTIVVIVGAFLMLWLGLVPFEDAVLAIDFNVIFLLVGMMICVGILARTGFFEYISVSVAKLSRGEPLTIMLLFLSVTTFLSAFLDNVTTIILLAPVTILVTQILEISPIPFLILEAIASNIGGTATLIGDPPNIIIGSRAGLSFNDFLLNLAPAILVAFGLFLLTTYVIFYRSWHVRAEIKMRVKSALPRLAIIDNRNMIKSLVILGAIFLGFFTHEITGMKPGFIALCGSMIMMLVCREDVDKTLVRVEWTVIFFFIGLFMMVSALEYNGLIEFLALKLITKAGHNLFTLCVVVICGSALFSCIFDNIPFVITMVPMVKTLVNEVARSQGVVDISLIQTEIANPLWWSLALGACLGGNGTLLGASANVVASRIAAKNGYRITFYAFSKYGLPFMLQSLLVAVMYVWLRYFVF
jgi:Na+/H+ antiporter NhaD/arsenite permease-like protein